MLLSSLTREQLETLTREQKASIIYNFPAPADEPADVAILLGGDLEVWEERLEAALEVYRRGLAPKMVVTGAVKRHLPEGDAVEAIALTERLVKAGVPESAILIEPEALTTQENMIYASLQIYRRLTWEKARKIIIITSQTHMRRSLALAREFLPNITAIAGYPSHKAEEMPPLCFGHPFYGMRVNVEIMLLHQLITTGQIPDIEF